MQFAVTQFAASVAEDSLPLADLQRIVIASLLALIIGETLLRFRAVAAVQSAGAMEALLRSIWWGLRYFLPSQFTSGCCG